jgi:hypothetical protein
MVAGGEIRTGRKHSESVQTGYTSELLAAADLNKRCGLAYLNPAPQTKHDAFAHTSLGWKTIQVKTARLFKTKNGVSMGARKRSEITSDIIALVDDQGMRVRYIANVGELPAELPSKPTPLCKGLVYLTDPRG